MIPLVITDQVNKDIEYLRLMNRYLLKAQRANDNALRCQRQHRRRNWNRAKYWNRQTSHYFKKFKAWYGRTKFGKST